MTIKFILNCILILCSVGMQGQYVYFNNIYSTEHPETTTAVEVMHDGYVTVTSQNNNGIGTVLLRKYSFTGEEIIQSSIESESAQNFFYVHGHAALKKASDSTLIYSGLFETADEVYTRIFLFNNELDTIWTTKLNLQDLPLVDMTVVEVLEDGYLFFGYVQYEIDRDILCVKLNLDGEYQWHWTLPDGSNSNYPFHVLSIEGNNFLLAGGGRMSNEFNWGWVKKVSEPGEVLWSHIFGETDISDGTPSSIVKLPNGHYQICYVHGEAGDPSYPDSQCRLVEFADSEDYMQISETNFETYWRHGVLKLLLSNQGRRIFTGGHYNLNETIDSYVESVDNYNSQEWMNFYSYDDCETCSNALGDIEFAPDSGYICTGYFIDYSEDIPINKTWLLKIDACGDVQYNGCPPSVNVHEETQNDSGISIWPNPARETLHLNADPGIEITSLRLFDLTGALAMENHLRHFTGSYSVDVSTLPGGYYFAEITDGKGNRQVFKLVME